MCVILYKKKGVPSIPEDFLSLGEENNPHGWGVAWPEYDRKKRSWSWLYAKTHENDKYSLVTTVNMHMKEKTDFLVHCRIASVGDVGMAQTHPFYLPSVKGILMHNGTLSIQPLSSKGTDSESLAQWLDSISNLAELLENDSWCARLGDLIDTSRLAIGFINTKGKPQVRIVNEMLWATKDAILASNESAWKQYHFMGKAALQGLPTAHGTRFSLKDLNGSKNRKSVTDSDAWEDIQDESPDYEKESNTFFPRTVRGIQESLAAGHDFEIDYMSDSVASFMEELPHSAFYSFQDFVNKQVIKPNKHFTLQQFEKKPLETADDVWEYLVDLALWDTQALDEPKNKKEEVNN